MRNRRYRFRVPHIGSAAQVTLDEGESHHARDVLRLQPGDRIRIFDGTGTECEAMIADGSTGRIVARIGRVIDASRELPTHIMCAASWPKGRRLDWMLQKLCELGVSSWIPLHSQRTLPAPPPARFIRLRKILEEAAKQCGRTSVPSIAPPASLEQIVTTFADHESVFVASPEAERMLITCAGGWSGPPKKVMVLIGPEGGFVPDEIKQAVDHHAIPVSLGRHTLRTETAAVAAVSLISQRVAELWSRDSIS